ncbi:hypothetical protein HYZ99_05615 [Candidatus Peregrinibacteria bacterium]|nr:hypothetical protein [Candidatus Peregrinibacteria bacterium]
MAQILLCGLSFQIYKPAETVLMSKAGAITVSCEDVASAPHVDTLAHEPCPADMCVTSFECPQEDHRSLAMETTAAVSTGRSHDGYVSTAVQLIKEQRASTYPESLLSIVLRV